MEKYKILFKGAGDFASGAIRRMHLCGFRVVCTELPSPLTVRRKVSFSEAVWDGEVEIEGVKGKKATPENFQHLLEEGYVAVIVDPELNILRKSKFDVLVDATMTKRKTSTNTKMAPIVIGLGPGFTAGKDCHAVIETLAGHNLGRVIYKGCAAQDTSSPLPPELYLCSCSIEATKLFEDKILLRAPKDGKFNSATQIGDIVEEGTVVGTIEGTEIKSRIKGVVRGLVHDGLYVKAGLKIGDIDPSCDVKRAFTISEKSNAIAGGIMEATFRLMNEKGMFKT